MHCTKEAQEDRKSIAMQAVGATTPAFTAALSFLMVNARESERTYAALLPVVIGIVIATGAEPSFNLAGFAAAVTATAARAFKSVLQVSCPLWSNSSLSYNPLQPRTTAFRTRAKTVTRPSTHLWSRSLSMHRQDLQLVCLDMLADLYTLRWIDVERQVCMHISQTCSVCAQGILLTDAAEKMDSMNLLRYMAPISLGVLVPATVFLEPTVFEIVSASRADVFFIAFLSLNAALAYFVNLLNFLVTKHTSALTLQVLGNGKGVAAVVVSVMVFRNPVTFASVIGYLITVSGVMLYMFAKRSSAAKNLPDEKGAGDIAV